MRGRTEFRLHFGVAVDFVVRHICSTMKTATVRDLRNHYTGILKWISSGEVVQITQRGKPVARLIPETPDIDSQIDWSRSPAMQRDRTKEKMLSSEESLALIREAGGQW